MPEGALHGRGRATDELGDVPRRHDHRVDAAPLELDDLVARDLRRLRDRELPDRHVREQLQRTFQVGGREVERLGIVPLENSLEHFLVRDADDEVEAELGSVRGRRVEDVTVFVARIGDDEHGVGARPSRILGRSAAAPEDRELSRFADACQRTANGDAFGAVRFRDACGLGSVDVDDHRDAVSLGDRLAESSRALFQEQKDGIRSGTLHSMRVCGALVVAVVLLALPAAAVGAVISGGPRADRITGTAKGDRIDTLFGRTDRVRCGRGVDAVMADRADVVASDCEFVTRPISFDTLTGAGQHQTEVEPSVAGWGPTAVATFQVGRYQNGGADGIGWAVSRDSGRTWRSGVLPGVTTATKPPGAAPRASDPAAAYDAAHSTWLVSTLILGATYTALGISRSADGATWSVPVLAANFSSSSLAYDKEWVGCDNTSTSPHAGSCYLVYTDEVAGRIASQVSHDGGATWGAPVTVTSTFGVDAEGALPVIQPNGTLTVVLDAGDSGIYAVRSVDGGATFGAPVGVAAITEAPRPFLRAPPLPAAAVDASGRIYVVWADCVFRTGCTGNTIVLSTSTDGVTWSSPARVPGTGFDSFVPGIAADPAKTGRISVVTYVRSAGSCFAAACTFGVSVTDSEDAGAHWSKPQRLDAASPRYTWLATAGGRFLGDYVGAAFAGGRFVPVFAFAAKPLSGHLREFMLSGSLP